MVLKSAIAAALCTGLLMSGSATLADEYRAGELFGLDPSRALLSPKRLGPETHFAPVRVEARNDARPVKTERVVVPKAAAPKTQPKTHVAHARVEKPTRVAHERVAKPRGAARAKLARRHTNPLDAQARDTRIQTWPCKSGGICDWQR
ncbi:hypothetical protein [Bradyrhizobium sp. AZCC 1620]|uniref:hypothetical protein n=1 Tax=unclassified Bradyrhizobium TaxID=2631580 RepID=UPI0030626934